MDAEVELPPDSSGRLLVELAFDGEPLSHPYRSERLLVSLSNISFPLARGADAAELVELVEHAVRPVILLPVDREVYRGRVAAEHSDCPSRLSSLFRLSLAACGTPSHLELTLGTVGGSLAEDTPGNPTAFARPLWVVPRFFICSW